MSDIVREQILAIRESGVSNMLHITQVQREANDREFYELVLYLEDHKDAYARFIITGEADDDV